jgi:hypothetical protein
LSAAATIPPSAIMINVIMHRGRRADGKRDPRRDDRGRNPAPGDPRVHGARCSRCSSTPARHADRSTVTSPAARKN